MGDKIDQFNVKQDENVEVSIDLESREYNGRWYTDVKAWKVSKDRVSSDNSPSYDHGEEQQLQNTNTSFPDPEDIPF